MHAPATPLPSYTIPLADDLREARTQLGEQLRLGFATAGMTDLAAIGRAVANAQEYPPREGIPYHAAVVESWFDGKALPSDETLETIQAMLADKTDERWRDRTDDLLDIACFNPQRAMHGFGKQLSSSLGRSIQHMAETLSQALGEAYKQKYIVHIFDGSQSPANTTALYGSMKQLLLREDIGMREAETVSRDFELLSELNSAFPSTSEFSATLRGYSTEAQLSNRALSRHFEPPLSSAAVGQWRTGRIYPALKQIIALDGIFSAKGVTLEPPLQLIHQLNGRIESERLWQEAQQDANFGEMLKSMRLLLGLSREEMATQLHARGATQFGAVALFKWETNKSLPSHKLFPQSDIITLYGEIMREHDEMQPTLLMQNYGTFWTDEREAALRATYKAVAAEHTPIGRHIMRLSR